MPNTYRVTDPVTGVTLDLQGDSPPTEEELTGIFKQYEKPSEVPQRRGVEQFTGVGREVSPAMSMLTPEQKKEALLTGVKTTAAMAAGPVAGTMLESATAIPAITRLGTAIKSGGLGPSLNWYERVIGGGLSGLLSGAVESPENALVGAQIGVATPAAARVIRPFMAATAPTHAELGQAYKQEYKKIDELADRVQPGDFNALVDQLRNTSVANQFLPSEHTKVARALNIFEEQAELNQPVSVERIDKLRRRLNTAANSGNVNESQIATAMRQNVDDFVQRQVPEAQENLDRARDLYTKFSRSKVIENILRRAESSSKPRSEFIQDEFEKISRGEGKFGATKRQFSKEEQSLIDDIAKGRLDISALENVADIAAPMIGPRLTRNDLARLMTLGSGLGTTYQYFGPQVAFPLAAAVTGTGVTSRALANRLALMRAQRLGAMARTGGRAGEPLRPEMYPNFAALISANALAQPTDFASQSQAINALSQ